MKQQKKSFPFIPTEKRNAEKERILAERDRRIAEGLSKIAGMQIENIEKTRKGADVISIMSRISAHCTLMNNLTNSLLTNEKESPSSPLPLIATENINYFLDTYRSIRHDIMINLNIKKEEFEKLFPARSTYFETRQQAANMLIGLQEQEIQLSIYLQRILVK